MLQGGVDFEAGGKGQPSRRPKVVVEKAAFVIFANEILALKPGEVIRSFLLARWANIPFPVALSTAIVERVFDGIWLFAGFYAISRYVALPGAVVIAAKVLMAILLLVCIALAAAVLHKRKPGGYLQSRRWARNLIPLADGLYAMGHSHTFLTSFALSFVYLALQVLPIYFVIRGYQLDLNIGVAAVILVMLRVSSAAPQAPGNLGTFQAAAVAGVKLFGYDKAEATGFATLLFIVVTMPLWIAGFFALLATRMKLDDLHRDAHYNADRHA